MLTTGISLHGFKIKKITDLPEYRGKGITASHEKTGCEIFHVFCDDKDNLFSFAFKTIPRDNTGVAHILEHTVLCGSRQYPVKDPFLILLKGSMNTFLNAITFPDKTVYPASSTVEKDLFNLMKVYGDAVFFPLLKKEMFSQEGHRIEIDDDGNPHMVGIVFNEMQGNYANHDSIASDWAYRSLFPDTLYRYDSGGEPSSISSLTYDDFLEFHRNYYHPSNTKIFLYGNIPTEDYLAFLQDEFLKGFDARPLHNEIPLQTRWSSPKELEVTYPVDPESELKGKASITVNWLLPPVTETLTALSLELITEILLGNSGSPLRKALIESGLGEDLSPPTGMESDLKELVFSAGIRGTDPEKKEELKALIFDVLKKQAENGIDQDSMESAMRTFEFRHREIKSHFGLRLMRRSLRGWLHGEEPEKTMVFAELMKEIRQRVNKKEGYFEGLIKKHLIDNPHRSMVTVKPDPEQKEREQEAIEAELNKKKSQWSKEDLQKIKEGQKKLTDLQAAPDKTEDIAKIPSLESRDLPRDVEKIPLEKMNLGNVPIFLHEIYTNRISYVEFLFDITDIDDRLAWFIPALGAAVTGCGLPGQPYDRVARELSLLTGGFGFHLEAGTSLAVADSKSYLSFRMKMLDRSAKDALSLFGELLAKADFSDQDRIEDLILEMRSDFISSVMPAGHSFVNLRTARGFSSAERIEERWKGISQLLFLHGIDVHNSLDNLCLILEELRRRILTRSNLTVNITGQEDGIKNIFPHIQKVIESLPEKIQKNDYEYLIESSNITENISVIDQVNRGESLIIPSSVGYVGMCIKGSSITSEDYPYEYIIAHLLKTGFLWESIRMRGGAYGAFAVANGTESIFNFASYRDPNIVRTLEAYKSSLLSLLNDSHLEESLRLAKIGTVGRDTRPMAPGEKGAISFRRALYGITDGLRQRKRDILLNAEVSDIQNSSKNLTAGLDSAFISVMSGKDALAAASKEFPSLRDGVFTIPQ